MLDVRGVGFLLAAREGVDGRPLGWVGGEGADDFAAVDSWLVLV